MEANKLLQLKNDIVFQELFGNQKNHEITAHLLSLILEREVKNVNLDLNKRMLGNRIDAKTGRLDVRAMFNDGEECNVEIQVAPYDYIEKRMLEYWATMYSMKINRGNGYKVLKPCISILIADYRIPKLAEIPEYKTKWNIREEKYKDLVLTLDMEMYILELPKIEGVNVNKDELALWLKFIENPGDMEVQKKMEEEGNKYLKQAMEELGYLSGDPDFKRLIDARVGFLRDQDALEERGKEQERKEIAKNLLKLNVEIEKIIEATGLTKEEIEKLQV